MPAARLDESLSFEPSASRPNLLPPYPGRLTFGSPPAANSSDAVKQSSVFNPEGTWHLPTKARKHESTKHTKT